MNQVNYLIALLALSLALASCSDTEQGALEGGLENSPPAATLEQLKDAILELDHNKLEQAVRTTDLNQLLPDGSTLLAWAVESQDLTNVDILMTQGAKTDPDGPETNHFTPMILACQYGQPDILVRLLEAKPHLDKRTDEGITPLALCAGAAPASIVEKMISMGADVDAADSYGQTPLMHAAAGGQSATMKLLLENGADVNRKTDQGFTPLFFAIKAGELAPAMTAVNAGADISHQSGDGTTALQLALYQHNYQFAAWLVEQDADLTAFDRNGQLPLHKAVLGNQPDLVQLMLAKGADPNMPSGPSTMTWRYEANFKIEDYEPPSLSPLFMAAQKGAVEVMQILADLDTNPEFTDDNGNNLVLAAASSGSAEALSLALTLLPKPREANSFGQTPLDIALLQTNKARQAELLKILEDMGVDIRSANTES